MIVRAVPARMEYVRYLKARLPDLEVVWDRGHDATGTFLRALGYDMAGGEGALHLEEDIELTTGFVQKVEDVLAEHGDHLVQFFSCRDTKDLTVGSRWDRDFLMAQCFWLPPGYAAEIRAYSARWPKHEEHPNGLDLMVGDWLRERRERYWLHVPSLVQHRRGPSMLGPRSSARQSATFTDPWL